MTSNISTKKSMRDLIPLLKDGMPVILDEMYVAHFISYEGVYATVTHNETMMTVSRARIKIPQGTIDILQPELDKIDAAEKIDRLLKERDERIKQYELAYLKYGRKDENDKHMPC